MTKNKTDISKNIYIKYMFIKHKNVSSSIKENRFPAKNIVTYNEIIYLFSCTCYITCLLSTKLLTK